MNSNLIINLSILIKSGSRIRLSKISKFVSKFLRLYCEDRKPFVVSYYLTITVLKQFSISIKYYIYSGTRIEKILRKKNKFNYIFESFSLVYYYSFCATK